MEEKSLKLMAQIGLVAVVIWIVFAALGKRNQVAVSAASSPPRGGGKWGVKGDVWQRSCVSEPYAQGTFEPGLYMGGA